MTDLKKEHEKMLLLFGEHFESNDPSKTVFEAGEICKNVLDFGGRCAFVAKHLNPATVWEDVQYHGWLTRDYDRIKKSRKISKYDKGWAYTAYKLYEDFAEKHFDSIEEQNR